MADTGFARGAYPDPVEYYPMTPCHLTESVQNDICEQIIKDLAPAKTVFTLPTRL
jgi:hypothetical protein